MNNRTPTSSQNNKYLQKPRFLLIISNFSTLIEPTMNKNKPLMYSIHFPSKTKIWVPPMNSPSKQPGPPPANYITKQLTIIGRGECGKTSITRRFLRNEFNEEICATPLENTDYFFQVGDRQYRLKIWDTSGQDDFLRLRTLTLSVSDYIMMCYSITDPLSFYEVENTLVPMVRQKAVPTVKIMLIATKLDKQSDDTISSEEGEALAKRIGAFRFIECSSLENIRIGEIFDELRRDIEISTEETRKQRFKCSLFCCD